MQVPNAQLRFKVDGGAWQTGGVIVSGGNAIQLGAVDATNWTVCLYEIFDYPDGFACPAGWTNLNGVYRSSPTSSSSFLPPSFAIDSTTNWGKYLFRLTVNDGILNGVLLATNDPTQRLTDETASVQCISPRFGFHDVCYLESNQFDAQRQWVGELKKDLRAIESVAAGGAVPGSPDLSMQYRTVGQTFGGASNVLYQNSHLNLLNELRFISSAYFADVGIAALGANVAITFPAATTTVVGTDVNQTLTLKTIDVANNTLTSTSISNGDILQAVSGKFVRLPIGTEGQRLSVLSGVLTWVTPTAREQRASLSKSANYTLVSTTDFHVSVTSTCTISLPAAPADGDTYEVKSKGAAVVTVNAADAKLIDGSASYTFVALLQSCSFRYSSVAGEWENR